MASGCALTIINALTNAATGAVSPVYEINLRGGLALSVFGTFGGATVAVQGSADGVNYATIAGLSATVAGFYSPTAALGLSVKYIKVTVTGGAGVSVTVQLIY